MGRHSSDRTALGRIEQMEADMADLQGSFEALRAKVEAAAAAQSQASDAAEAAMAAKLDELAAYVDANFLTPGGGDVPASPPAPEPEPAPVQEESHGWRPGQ